MGLLLGAPSFISGIDITDENKTDTFLFCIKKERPILNITRGDNGIFLSVDNTQVQSFIDKHNIIPKTSLGISIFPDDGDTINLLLQRADIAMYSAKEKGSNNFIFYSKNIENV